MADMNHSKLPNLSIGTLDGNSGVSAAFLNVDSTASLTVGGIAAFTGNESHTGAETHSGAVTYSGTVKLGTAGLAFASVRSSRVSVALGATAADSVETTLTIPNIALGDPVLAIVPASIWSGAYNDIGLSCLASAASTAILSARNSTTTTVNTAAMNFDIFWLDLA
jgi:hypothetical protein